MRYRKKNLVKCFIFAIVGISLLFQYSPALSGNKVLPGQTWTNTTPLPSTTPSMEYQQVDKPPVKKLDIPDYDIAGELKNVEIKNYLRGNTKAKMMKFQIALINKGTQKGSRSIPFKIRIINVRDQTLLKEESNSYRTDLRNDYWVLTQLSGLKITD